jgi:hypothetical protein
LLEWAGTTDIIVGYHVGRFGLDDSEQRANMIFLQPPTSAEERKRVAQLEVARRLYQALVAQDPDRLITLRDGGGRVLARHDLRPEQGEPEAAS